MGRSLRIEYPGAWYHVMNRGLCRREVFHTQEYASLFYDLLEEIHKRYQVEIHAYCLMGNHYHLCIRTPLANLGKAMRHMNGEFTRKYNQLIKGDGPLFRGRYKAILVDASTYFLRLTRYIHLNPVTAGIVQYPQDYIWSSYRYLFTNQEKPHWLYFNEIFKFFETSNPIYHYEKFVLDGIDLDIKSFFKKQKTFPILGSKNFIEKIKKGIKQPLPMEIPDSLQVIKYNNTAISIKDIVNVVAKYYNTCATTILVSKKPNNTARNVTVYLCVLMLEKTQAEIGKFFNNLSYYGISKIYCRLQLKIKENSILCRDIERIKTLLSKNLDEHNLSISRSALNFVE